MVRCQLHPYCNPEKTYRRFTETGGQDILSIYRNFGQILAKYSASKPNQKRFFFSYSILTISKILQEESDLKCMNLNLRLNKRKLQLSTFNEIVSFRFIRCCCCCCCCLFCCPRRITVTIALQIPAPVPTPASELKSVHKFAIQNGKTRVTSQVKN